MPQIAMSQVMQFHSGAVDDGELQITALEGKEAISKPYEFHLELVSKKSDLDFTKLIKERAWIGIKQGVQLADSDRRAATTLKIHGVLSNFEQIGKELEWVKYKAVLVPKLQRLALNHQSRIFQSKKIPDLVKEICDDHDIEVDTGKLGEYDEREFIVQYEETDLDFIHRWLEHEGIFYYFEQTEDHEKIILADSPEGYGSMPGKAEFNYRPGEDDDARGEAGDSEESAEDWFREEVIRKVSCNQKILPKEVVLNDYNWRDPDTQLECKATVSDDGEGVFYEYNDHYQTVDQGKKLAQIRAEAINAREKLFPGISECRGFRAGMKFTMKEHYRDDFNAEYLLLEVSHSATQSVALGSSGAGSGASYRNEFLAIPKSKKFRPEAVTPWPSIKGVMHAKIEGEDNNNERAEIDDLGRYKVRLPLDRGDAQPGHASKYVRKSESYAGPDQGMHFPLKPGSEVLVTHIDGDPDRPIISGAVFNKKNTNVVVGSTHVHNRIFTSGENQILLNDAPGSPSITINTISHNTNIWMDGTAGSEAITINTSVSAAYIRVGKGQGESTPTKVTNKDGVYIHADDDINLHAGADYNLNCDKKNEEIRGTNKVNILGNDFTIKEADDFCITHGQTTNFFFGAKQSVTLANQASLTVGFNETVQAAADLKATYGASAVLQRADGFETTFGHKLTISKSSSRDLHKDDKFWKVAKEASLEAVGKILIDSKMGEIELDAMNKITLKCGPSTIELNKQSIQLKYGAAKLKIDGSGVVMDAPKINIKATGPLNCVGNPGGYYK